MLLEKIKKTSLSCTFEENETLPKTDKPFEGTLQGFTSPDPIKFITEKVKDHLTKLKRNLSQCSSF